MGSTTGGAALTWPPGGAKAGGTADRVRNGGNCNTTRGFWACLLLPAIAEFLFCCEIAAEYGSSSTSLAKGKTIMTDDKSAKVVLGDGAAGDVNAPRATEDVAPAPAVVARKTPAAPGKQAAK